MARAGSTERQVAVLLHEAKKGARPDAAAALLALAADYLRSGDTMPEAMAMYLADALAKAARAEAPERGNVLARELRIKHSANAPTKGRQFDVFLAVTKHDAKVQSLPEKARPMKKELVSEVMEILGVSERTAWDRIKKARVGMAAAPIQSRE